MTSPSVECKHTVTQGKDGQTGSWCVKCGIKVYEVHDRPCGECKHCWTQGIAGMGGYTGCSKLMMRVSEKMHVTYNLIPRDGMHRLCFEEKE